MTFGMDFAWRPMRSDVWLRVGGCIAAVVVGGATLADGLAGGLDPILADMRAHPSKLTPASLYAGWTVVTILLIAVFIAAFWRAMMRGERGVGDARTHLLLAVQALLALIVNQELVYLIAMELPLLLPLREALGWAGGLLLATIGALIASGTAWQGSFIPSEGLEHLPHVWQIAFTGGSLVGWQAFAFCAGCFAGVERRNRRELARVNAEISAAHHLLAHDSRLAERVHISRELHDTLGHYLTALKLHLDLARRVVNDTRAIEAIAQADHISGAMLRDVRGVVASMREDRPFELGAALREMLSGIVEPVVHLSLSDPLLVNDTAHAHVLFRAVQEGVTNVIRHANAANLWIAIADHDGTLQLTIRDDGRGVRTIDGGHGLIGMDERVEELRGQLTIDSQPGRGLSLQVRLPLTAGELG